MKNKAATDDDKTLYGGKGLVAKELKNAPMVINEKVFPHRCAAQTDCYDCGQPINRGETMMVSAVEITKGMQGTSPRYNLHEACYEVVGRVISIIGKAQTHTMKGRATLQGIWNENAEAIRSADAELADMIQGVFGKPKKAK